LDDLQSQASAFFVHALEEEPAEVGDAIQWVTRLKVIAIKWGAFTLLDRLAKKADDAPSMKSLKEIWVMFLQDSPDFQEVAGAGFIELVRSRLSGEAPAAANSGSVTPPATIPEGDACGSAGSKRGRGGGADEAAPAAEAKRARGGGRGRAAGAGRRGRGAVPT
jgi:hypothetical protein